MYLGVMIMMSERSRFCGILRYGFWCFSLQERWLAINYSRKAFQTYIKSQSRKRSDKHSNPLRSLLTCMSQQPAGLCCENSGWTPKETDSKDYLGRVQSKNGRKMAGPETETPEKERKNRERKQEHPLRHMCWVCGGQCLVWRAPGFIFKGHRLGSEVISHCLGLTTIAWASMYLYTWTD